MSNENTNTTNRVIEKEEITPLIQIILGSPSEESYSSAIQILAQALIDSSNAGQPKPTPQAIMISTTIVETENFLTTILSKLMTGGATPQQQKNLLTMEENHSWQIFRSVFKWGNDTSIFHKALMTNKKLSEQLLEFRAVLESRNADSEFKASVWHVLGYLILPKETYKQVAPAILSEVADFLIGRTQQSTVITGDALSSTPSSAQEQKEAMFIAYRYVTEIPVTFCDVMQNIVDTGILKCVVKRLVEGKQVEDHDMMLSMLDDGILSHGEKSDGQPRNEKGWNILAVFAAEDGLYDKLKEWEKEGDKFVHASVVSYILGSYYEDDD